MSTRFVAHNLPLSDLLGERAQAQLRMPDYQRGFSWTWDEAGQFFQDMLGFAEKRASAQGDEYFLGPVVLMRGHTASRYDFLVDGQQRLATALIMCSSIRDLAEEHADLVNEGSQLATRIQESAFQSRGPKGGARASLVLSDLDQNYFDSTMMKPGCAEAMIPMNESNGRVKRVRNRMDAGLRQMLEGRTDVIADLGHLFDSIWNGVGLVAIEVGNDTDAMEVFERINFRGRELSEADLVLHRLMMEQPQTVRRTVRKEWNAMSTVLETQIGTKGDLMGRFLRHLWIAEFGYSKSDRLSQQVANLLQSGEMTSLELCTHIREACSDYAALHNINDKRVRHDARAIVHGLVRSLRVSSCLPLLLAALRRFGKDKEFLHVVQATDALVVRHRLFCDRSQADLDKTLFGCAALVSRASSKSAAAEEALSVLKAATPRNDEVLASSRRAMKLGKRQALYILRGIENYLQKGAFDTKATLEHIFPQKPGKQWGNTRPMKDHVWHLGNMALLTDNDNKGAGNREFGYKKKRVYKSAELKITRRVCDYQRWGKAAIERRAQDLAEIAIQRWRA